MGVDESSKKDTVKTRGFSFESLIETRKQLEKSLIPQSPIAYSTDGVSFRYEAPLSLPLTIGSYVTITNEDGEEYFGQVITQENSVKDGPEYGMSMQADASITFIAKTTTSGQLRDRIRVRYIQGLGILLAKVKDGAILTTRGKAIFQDAKISKAPENLITQFLALDDNQSTLDIGRANYTDGTSRVNLSAKGFARHTFLCGQSGSGKTFALGVILEQLLLETDLRILCTGQK